MILTLALPSQYRPLSQNIALSALIPTLPFPTSVPHPQLLHKRPARLKLPRSHQRILLQQRLTRNQPRHQPGAYKNHPLPPIIAMWLKSLMILPLVQAKKARWRWYGVHVPPGNLRGSTIFITIPLIGMQTEAPAQRIMSLPGFWPTIPTGLNMPVMRKAWLMKLTTGTFPWIKQIRLYSTT